MEGWFEESSVFLVADLFCIVQLFTEHFTKSAYFLQTIVWQGRAQSDCSFSLCPFLSRKMVVEFDDLPLHARAIRAVIAVQKKSSTTASNGAFPAAPFPSCTVGFLTIGICLWHQSRHNYLPLR